MQSGTPSKDRKKMKEKTIPNSFKGHMWMQVFSWKPNPEGHQQGAWEFFVWDLHFVADPFVCKATDLNTKRTGKIQIQI